VEVVARAIVEYLAAKQVHAEMVLMKEAKLPKEK